MIYNNNDGKRPLPMYQLPPPAQKKRNGKYCIVYPLFLGYENFPDSSYYPYITNSAFWAAHSWRVNTDCIEQGWDIYFFVERKLYEQPDIRAQFEQANLTDFVILFDEIKGEAIKEKVGMKLYAMIHPFFKDYERVYLFDSDMFFNVLPDTPAPVNIECILNIGNETQPNSYNFWICDPFLVIGIPYLEDYKGAELEGINRLIKHMGDYLGENLKLKVVKNGKDTEYHISNRPIYLCQGSAYAWNPKKLCKSALDMVEQLTPNIAHDEKQIGLYYTKHTAPEKSLEQIWEIPTLIWGDTYVQDYIDIGWLGKTCFFDHVVNADWQQFREYNPFYDSIWK